MCIDSGSNKNIIGDKTWEFLNKMKADIYDFKSGSSIVFKSYGSNTPLQVIGSFTANLNIFKTNSDEKFYIIKGGQTSLIGKETAIKLGILKLGLPIQNIITNPRPKKLPAIKGIEVDIPIDRNIPPVSQPYRRIPIPIEASVDNKLDELLENDIIEPVSEYTGWVSPMVIVTKANKEIRICIDMRRANKAVLREKYPMPTIEDLLPKLKSASVFSSLDIKQAFHQITIKPTSRDITTFITRRGLYRYKRLMFGISCAPEIFQKTMEHILKGCNGIFVYIDDILIFADNEKQHDERLLAVKQRLSEYGVILNENKCKTKLPEIIFLGHKISKNNIKPTSSRIEAVQQFREPKSIEEVRSFLGLINYVSRFIPDVATKTYPLRKIIKNNTFSWNIEQKSAFEKLKMALTDQSSLGLYVIEDPTFVIADASPVGLGAILGQTGKDGPRIIAYGHRSLSEREQKYHITEKEAMALVWAVEHFHRYLLGKKFDLITDHKPLEFMFNPKHTPCARIERWVLRLQIYDFNVVYKPGKTNIADPLSRLPIQQQVSDLFEDDVEYFINEITNSSNLRAITINEMNEVSKNDQEIKLIKKCLNNTDLWEHEKSIQMFKPFKPEYCFHENLLLRGTKIVVPKELRTNILALGHEGHPGVESMKRSLRSKVWWPKIDTDIAEFVKSCHECNLVTVANTTEPLKMRTFPTAPWTDIAIDFCGPMPNNIYLLVVIDYYSRFKEVILMEKITSNDTIEQLRKLFSLLGLPQTITADNGRQLVSQEFKKFCAEHGIKLYTTPPYWPQANGLVERQNNSLMKRLRISAITRGNDWKKDLQTYLLMYRNTPHPTTGVSPAELLFGRKTRTKVPSLSDQITPNDSEVRDHDLVAKAKTKAYVDSRRRAKPSNINIGDTVLVKQRKENKLTAPYKNELYTVIDKHFGDVKLRSETTGELIRRNIAHLKLYTGSGTNSGKENHYSPDGEFSDDDTPNGSIGNSEMPETVSLERRHSIPKLRIRLNDPTPTCTIVDPDSESSNSKNK